MVFKGWALVFHLITMIHYSIINVFFAFHLSSGRQSGLLTSTLFTVPAASVIKSESIIHHLWLVLPSCVVVSQCVHISQGSVKPELSLYQKTDLVQARILFNFLSKRQTRWIHFLFLSHISLWNLFSLWHHVSPHRQWKYLFRKCSTFLSPVILDYFPTIYEAEWFSFII